jgi:soluble lytic murein transglycosylase-like protein
MIDRIPIDLDIASSRSPKSLWRWIPFVALLCLPLAAGAASPSAQEIDPDVVAALARSVSNDVEEGDPYDAQVWLLSSLPKVARYVVNKTEQELILRTVYREAKRHDKLYPNQKMDPDLVLALMQVESRFDRFAVSSAGAQGLMQVMPFWRNEIGRPQDNLTQIETNVRYGTAILGQYVREARNDLFDALARYNGSRGRPDYPELVVRAYRTRWQTQTTDDLPMLQAGCRAYSLAACNAVRSARH